MFFTVTVAISNTSVGFIKIPLWNRSDVLSSGKFIVKPANTEQKKVAVG